MALELRHFRYFVAVAEEGHITRAAERLGMQQPPLSQRIRFIEEELGAQLFLRRPRGVDLTEAGHAFLDIARSMLSQYDGPYEASNAQRAARQGVCASVLRRRVRSIQSCRWRSAHSATSFLRST